MEINIHLHHHYPVNEEIKQNFSLIHQKLDLIMTKQEKFDANLGRLNTATNEIASDMQKLREDHKNGTLTDESFDRFDQHIAVLEGLGADPADPIPAPPEEGTASE